LDIALVGNFVGKPSNGWYQKLDRETGEFIGQKIREKDTLNEEFWKDILASKDFQKFITDSFQVGHAAMFQQNKVEEDDDAGDE
jgi:hypothetical protein